VNARLRVALVLALTFSVTTLDASAAAPPSAKAFKGVSVREGSGVLSVEAVSSSGTFIGAGIIVGPKLVATVEHLIHGAAAVTLRRGGKSIGVGTVIGADPVTDLALIQSDTTLAGYEFKLGSDVPKIGAVVATLGGSPLTATPGTVAALSSVLRVSGTKRTGLARTTALVASTSSGGPIVTATGSLVGLVDVGTKTANGSAYAVTSAVAAPLLKQWAAAPQPIAGTTVNGCVVVPPPKARPDGNLKAILASLDAGKKYDVTMQTNCGTFTFRLDQAESPNATGSFVELVLKGFFDHTIFHRIVPGFVIQGGDPTGTGGGGAGYETIDTPPSDATYTQGVVAMAKLAGEAPGTAGSQFFIVTGANPALAPDYAIIGNVISGLDVVERISLLGDANQKPTQVVEIESATVTVG
jgi:peptidyl-prolyl cis-trans isomerase B (cyclophilin B)